MTMTSSKRSCVKTKMTKELLKAIIKKWTDEEVNDSKADRDALEAIVAHVCTDNDLAAAGSLINSWRKEAIKQK